MDFSGFRDTGELSDMTVLVEGSEFKLHKFPLYIKSDFFRALARNPPKETIELTDFPGGATTFEMVANYCYNVKISITKENVCGLRCAAEFLQMNSRGNLADVADRFLADTLTSAKLGRHLGCIIDLVMESAELGPIAEQAGVIEKCLNAIVDCWLLSTKFTKRLPTDRFGSTTMLTEREVYDRIAKFPLGWFGRLVEVAREKGVRPHVLASLVQTYVNRAVQATRGEDLMGTAAAAENAENEEEIDPKEEKKESTKATTKAAAGESEAKESEEEEEEEEESAEDKPDEEGQASEQAEEESQETDEQKEQKKEDENKDTDPTPATNSADGTPVDPENSNDSTSEASSSEPIDLKELLDTIVPRLPDTILFADLLSPVWSLGVLLLGEELECECRPALRKLVGLLLHRLTPRQLADMPPATLADVVREACGEEGGSGEPAGKNSLVCGVIDSYLRELAERGELSVDTFTTMVQAVPTDYRLSHDTLFQVLEALLQSDKVKLTDEQKSALMDSVDFGRLSESTLQRAYESDLVPQAHVTKAALALCSRLRTELESARSVIKSQEEEMSRYGLRRHHRSTTPQYYSRSTETPPQASSIVSSASKVRYQAPGITYTYPSGAISSLSSDLELQLALDSMETRQRSAHSDYTHGSSYGDSYYDDPYDTDPYRSKAYYRNVYDKYNYRY